MLKMKRVDWTNLLQSANSLNEASEFPVKLPPTFLIFTMGTFFSTEHLLPLLISSIDDRLATFACCDLACFACYDLRE